MRELSTGQRAAAPFATEAGFRGVAFFPDGEHVATFGGQNWTKVWKISTLLKIPENLLFRAVGTLLVAPDEKTIAYVDAYGWPALYDVARHRASKLALDTAPRVGAAKAGSRPRTRGSDNAARMHGLVPWHFTPDGRTLVAAAFAGSARANPTAFDVNRGVEVPIETLPEDVRPPGAPAGQSFRGFLLAMHAASDSKMFYLLQSMQQGAPRGVRSEPPYLLWDGAQSHTVPALGETAGGLKLPCFSERGTFVAGLLPGIRRRTKGAVEQSGPAVVVLSTSDGKLVSRIPCGSDDVISLRFTGAEDALLLHQRVTGKATALGEFSLAAFDPRSGRELNQRAGLRTTFLAVSDDGGRLASPVEGAILIESPATKTELGRIAFDDWPMQPVAFLAAGTKLITTGANGAIRLWDSSGRPIAVPRLQEVVPIVEPVAPATKANVPVPRAPAAPRRPATAKAGKPSQARLADELKEMAVRLNGSPQGAYRGRFPALAAGCEMLASKLAAGETPTADIAKEMERFIKDAKDLKEEGGKHSPFKDFNTTYTDRSGRSGLPGYKAKFFHEARDLFGKTMSRSRETPILYGQRLFAEMIMTLERQIEDLTGKLPDSSLLEEWRKAGPESGDKPGG